MDKRNKFAKIGVNHNKNHKRAVDDFYSTDPNAIKYLLNYEKFNKNIWEPACGNGNLVNVLKQKSYNVTASDIKNRNCEGQKIKNFLTSKTPFKGDIITNPPYAHAGEFIQKAYELSNQKVAMFLKIQFLESINRYENIFNKTPPKTVYVFVKRIACYRNNIIDNKPSAVCYAWYVWDKNYKGETTLKWIPNHRY